MCAAAGQIFMDTRIRACTAVIDRSTANSDDLFTAFNNRGAAYRMKGAIGHAISDLNEAIRLNPKSAGALNNRGNAFADRGDLDRALADHSAAIELNPNYGSAFGNRGEVYFRKGDDDRALADLNQAIQLEPKNSTAYYRRGVVSAAKGNFLKAVEDYNEAQRLDSDESALFRNRGVAYEALGESARALEDADRAIAYDPSDFEAYELRGRISFFESRYDAAGTDFSRSIFLRSDSSRAMLWLYLTQARINTEFAKTKLSEAATKLNALEWPYPLIQFYLGMRTADDVRASTRTPFQRCQAEFFIAEWFLLKDERATTTLQEAAQDCPRSSAEYADAQAELKRLRERATSH